MHVRLIVVGWLAVVVLASSGRGATPEHPGVIIKFDGATGAYLGDFVPVGSGGLDMAQTVTFGPDGDLYVTSWYTHSVKRYSGLTGAYLGDFIPPGLGGLANPDDLKFGADGNAYISARFKAQILRYNGATGAFMDEFVSDSRLAGFVNFNFGPDGDLYAGMFNGDHHIMRYDGSTGVALGPFDQGGPVLGNAYAGVNFGPDGNLYAVRMHNRSVQKYNGTTGQYLGYFIPPGNPNITSPRDLRFRADGRVFLVDQGDANLGRDFGSILEFTASGDYVGRFDHGRPLAYRLSSDLEFGPDGNLYVAALETGAQALSEVYVGSAAIVEGNGGGGSSVNSFSVPAVWPAEYAGTVTALSPDGRVMTDSAATWADDQFNGGNGPHYVVFDSGLFVRIVDTEAVGQTLTLAVPAVGVGVGDVYRVRRHWTVASVLGPGNEIGLRPGADCAEADTVLLNPADGQGTAIVFYDSAAEHEGWQYCDGSPADAHRICRGQVITIERKAASAVLCFMCGVALELNDHEGQPDSAYVDDGYVGLNNHMAVDWPYTGAIGWHYIGYDAFSSIEAGMAAVRVGGQVFVAPGDYGSASLPVSSATVVLQGAEMGGASVLVSGTGVLKGNGAVGTLVVQEGGTVSPGTSPGTINAGNTTWGPGGNYEWEINDATGTAGSSPGWDLLNITGTLDITADAGSKFTVKVVSLALDNSAGPAANFDHTQNYSWTIATASGGVVGFDPSKFTLETTGFQNPTSGGTFSVAASGNSLNVVYTPPSATAVRLVSFTAVRSGEEQVTVRWRTGVEYDVIGFHVERQDGPSAWVRINAGLIPAMGSGRPGAYTLADSTGPANGATRYRLVEVNIRGQGHVISETGTQLLRLVRVSRNGDSLVQEVQAAPGARVILESTLDLVRGTWVTIAPISLDSAGIGVATVTTSAGEPLRFYRLRLE